MFVDEAKIYVKAGDGGNGCVSFRREKFVPKGGPNGGDGGKGGDVVILVEKNLSTLLDFKYRQHFKAQRGEHGMGKNMYGAKGDDCLIKVPVGTIVKDADTLELLSDLDEDGEEFIVARGGQGGRGNTHFKSSTNRTPTTAEKGRAGEARWLVLELKLLADVGLIGIPNAGKSTLLSRISDAKPKIADYPFTTLIPNLGLVRVDEEQSFVVADIPGLIECAHKGKGVGIEFLKHIERTKLLLHILDLSQGESRNPIADFEMINRELRSFSRDMAEKPQIVVGNKIDLPEARKRCEECQEYFQAEGYHFFPISAMTGEGILPLLRMVMASLFNEKGREKRGNRLL